MGGVLEHGVRGDSNSGTGGDVGTIGEGHGLVVDSVEGEQENGVESLGLLEERVELVESVESGLVPARSTNDGLDLISEGLNVLGAGTQIVHGVGHGHGGGVDGGERQNEHSLGNVVDLLLLTSGSISHPREDVLVTVTLLGSDDITNDSSAGRNVSQQGSVRGQQRSNEGSENVGDNSEDEAGDEERLGVLGGGGEPLLVSAVLGAEENSGGDSRDESDHDGRDVDLNPLVVLHVGHLLGQSVVELFLHDLGERDKLGGESLLDDSVLEIGLQKDHTSGVLAGKVVDEGLDGSGLVLGELSDLVNVVGRDDDNVGTELSDLEDGVLELVVALANDGTTLPDESQSEEPGGLENGSVTDDGDLDSGGRGQNVDDVGAEPGTKGNVDEPVDVHEGHSVEAENELLEESLVGGGVHGVGLGHFRFVWLWRCGEKSTFIVVGVEISGSFGVRVGWCVLVFEGRSKNRTVPVAWLYCRTIYRYRSQ